MIYGEIFLFFLGYGFLDKIKFSQLNKANTVLFWYIQSIEGQS